MTTAQELVDRLGHLSDELEEQPIRVAAQSKELDEVIKLLETLSTELRQESTRDELQGPKVPRVLRQSMELHLRGGPSSLAKWAASAAANYGAYSEERLDLLYEHSFPRLVMNMLEDGDLRSITVERPMFAYLMNAVVSKHEKTMQLVAYPQHLDRLLRLAHRYCNNTDFSVCAAEIWANAAEWLWTIIDEVSEYAPQPFVESINNDTLMALIDPLGLFLAYPIDRDPDDPPSQHRDFAINNQKQSISILDHCRSCLEHIFPEEVDSQQSSPPAPLTGLAAAQKALADLMLSSTPVWCKIPAAMAQILAFIEHGQLPPDWQYPDESEEGDETDTDDGQPKSDCEKILGRAKLFWVNWMMESAWTMEYDSRTVFWQRIRRWFVTWNENGRDRDDLAQCALVCLANACRNEGVILEYLKGAESMTDILLNLLVPGTSVKIQHGVLGLLRNMANSKPSHEPLIKAGILDRLAEIKVLCPERDMISADQGQTCTLLKKLCSANVDISCLLVNHDVLLDQVLALFWRTEEVSVACEAARVVCNIIRSLMRVDTPHITEISKMSEDRYLAIFVDLLRRAEKYEVLVHEAIIGLVLLCRFGDNTSARIVSRLAEPFPAAGESQGGYGCGDEVLRGIVNDKLYSPELQQNTQTLLNLLSARGAASEA